MFIISRQPKFTDTQVQSPAVICKGYSFEMHLALTKVCELHWTSPQYFRKDGFCDHRVKIETIENSEVILFMSVRPSEPYRRGC